MTISDEQRHPGKEPLDAAQYHEGAVLVSDDACIHQRVFAYQTDQGVVAGVDLNVMFTIERGAKYIWPHLKDFNRWQNSYGYFYSRVVGDLYSSWERDLGEQTFHITINKPNEAAEEYPYSYRVLKVIPERLIVIFQPVPSDGSNGAVSPGFHVIMLNEHGGKTVVTIQMEHASRTRDTTEQEALEAWRQYMPEYERFWRDIFIPNLKKLVHEG
jgi:hypothetical protein